MKKIRKILSSVSSLLPLSNMRKISGQHLIFPFYHTISNVPLKHICHLYPLRSVDDFRQDIKFLKKHFKAIPITEIEKYKNSKQPAFHLTFDDGLKELFDIIAPILEEEGVPATFFINPAFVDNKDMMYRYKASLLIDKIKTNATAVRLDHAMNFLHVDNSSQLIEKILDFKYEDAKIINDVANILDVDFMQYLSDTQPYLTSELIRNLKQRGFSIGSHSMDHPIFHRISKENQKKQISESFQFLESNFSIDYKYFSFPFSGEKVTKELIDWMNQDEGCKYSFDISGIKIDYKDTHIHRILMEEDQYSARQIIKSEYGYFLLKKLFNKNKITRT